MSTWNKDSRYRFKQNVFNFSNFLQYNFTKDEIFKEETFANENIAKFRDFTMPKHTSSVFFCQSNFTLKKF